jgi:hypothetical protein
VSVSLFDTDVSRGAESDYARSHTELSGAARRTVAVCGHSRNFISVVSVVTEMTVSESSVTITHTEDRAQSLLLNSA